MSNWIDHARRELDLCGQTAEDPGYAATLVAAVAVFASYGHSGGSASVAIEQLYRLLQFRALSPLTSDPGEWFDHSLSSGTPIWQNRRDSAAFSSDGGQTWYYVDGREPGPKDPGVTAVTEPTEDLVHMAVAGDPAEELLALTLCRCDPAWTERQLHAPGCLEKYRVDVEALVAERDLFKDRLSRAERIVGLLDGEKDESQWI